MMAGIEALLANTAGLTARDAGDGPGEAFLYAELAKNVVGPSLFKELPDRLRYVKTSRELDHSLLDLWDAAPDDRKFRALLLTVTGDRFDARFQYDDEWDDEEATWERRPRVLAAKYGDKPVEYPEADWEG